MKLSGKIVFASGRATDFDIWKIDLASGALTQLTTGRNLNEFPRWSPDGGKIAFIAVEDDLIPSVTVMDADGRNKRRLTTGIYCQYPSWSPDGRKILFLSNAKDRSAIDVSEVSADGGEITTLFSRDGVESEPSWSPDGRCILFSGDFREKNAGPSDHNTEILEYNVAAQNFTRLTSHPTKDYGAAYSPDGNRIAFISHRNRTTEAEYKEKQAKIADQVATGDMRALNDAIRDLQAIESDGDIFVMNRDGSGLKQLTKDSYADQGVCWSPCGKYLAHTSTSMKSLGAERIKIIDSTTGAKIGFTYDRKALGSEIGAEQLLNGSIFQRLVPNFIERRFADRSFWGEERHPHWTK